MPRRQVAELVLALALPAGAIAALIARRLAAELAAGANAGTLALEFEQPDRPATTLEQLASLELADELLGEARRAVG